MITHYELGEKMDLYPRGFRGKAFPVLIEFEGKFYDIEKFGCLRSASSYPYNGYIMTIKIQDEPLKIIKVEKNK